MRLIIGNKNYSSWSLRAWLALRQFGLPFEEERVALFEPGYKERILGYCAAGKVPVLIDGGVVGWESLAIGEYLAEKLSTHGVWAANAALRTSGWKTSCGRSPMPLASRKRSAKATSCAAPRSIACAS